MCTLPYRKGTKVLLTLQFPDPPSIGSSPPLINALHHYPSPLPPFRPHRRSLLVGLDLTTFLSFPSLFCFSPSRTPSTPFGSITLIRLLSAFLAIFYVTTQHNTTQHTLLSVLHALFHPCRVTQIYSCQGTANFYYQLTQVTFIHPYYLSTAIDRYLACMLSSFRPGHRRPRVHHSEPFA